MKRPIGSNERLHEILGILLTQNTERHKRRPVHDAHELLPTSNGAVRHNVLDAVQELLVGQLGLRDVAIIVVVVVIIIIVVIVVVLVVVLVVLVVFIAVVLARSIRRELHAVILNQEVLVVIKVERHRFVVRGSRCILLVVAALLWLVVLLFVLSVRVVLLAVLFKPLKAFVGRGRIESLIIDIVGEEPEYMS